MIKKILIANRGEIAVRILQTCRMLGIKTVVAYSKCDKDTLAVFLADEAVCVGGDESVDSYLKMDAILEAAKMMGCDGLHPGYGFLSENAEFAKRVEENGMVFVGPSPIVLSKISNKKAVKKIANKLGIPVIPFANEDSFPLMIKPCFGGGGKGIKVAYDAREYDDKMKLANQEMRDEFGEDKFFLEEVIDTYKHIDIQFIADKNGKVTVLPARDCSIQKDNQKMIEETPVMGVSGVLLDKMKRDVVKLISEVDYDNVGTVEFLVDKQMNYYFLEINSRIQVEHTITEEVTGIDLIEQQIKMALGQKNDLPKEMIADGNAIECRLSARRAGELNIISLPFGKDVRVDTFVYQGYQIKPFYDSLIAKIIVSDKDRMRTIDKMKMALDETIILGVSTNVDELFELIDSKEFATGNYSCFMGSDE